MITIFIVDITGGAGGGAFGGDVDSFCGDIWYWNIKLIVDYWNWNGHWSLTK